MRPPWPSWPGYTLPYMAARCYCNDAYVHRWQRPVSAAAGWPPGDATPGVASRPGDVGGSNPAGRVSATAIPAASHSRGYVWGRPRMAYVMARRPGLVMPGERTRRLPGRSWGDVRDGVGTFRNPTRPVDGRLWRDMTDSPCMTVSGQWRPRVARCGAIVARCDTGDVPGLGCPGLSRAAGGRLPGWRGPYRGWVIRAGVAAAVRVGRGCRCMASPWAVATLERGYAADSPCTAISARLRPV